MENDQLLQSTALENYVMSKQVRLPCDASPYGQEAVSLKILGNGEERPEAERKPHR